MPTSNPLRRRAADLDTERCSLSWPLVSIVPRNKVVNTHINAMTRQNNTLKIKSIYISLFVRGHYLGLRGPSQIAFVCRRISLL